MLTYRFAVVAFLAVLICHPIMFTQTFSPQSPDDPANALVAFLANRYTPYTPRIVITKRESTHVRPILAELRIPTSKVG
jgi:hypothetical protein